MDEKTAWVNFANTGSISDYLIYSQLKETSYQSQEDIVNANSYRWTGNNGKKHR